MPDVIYGVTWNGKNVLNYTYDSLGRLTNKTIPLYSEEAVLESLNTTYEYYDVNDSKTTTLLKSISTEGIYFGYEYDELGNITTIDYNGASSSSYEYDQLNQLVRENSNIENKTYTYEYVNGNIKYKHEYAYTTGTLPLTPKKTTEYHYEDSTWSDVLTKITETTYSNRGTSSYSLNSVNSASSFDTIVKALFGNREYEEVDLTANALIDKDAIYESSALNTSTNSRSSTNFTNTLYTFQSDAIGNITSIGNGVVNLEWNGRRLESISQNGTELISYEYNVDGQRVSKTANGVTTEFFYNGDILAGQKTGDNVLIFMYDNNGDVFGFTYNGTPYYYVKNAQNDVWLIANEDGQAVVLYYYDAWGKLTFALDATDFGLAAINPFMYRSYYIDIEVGYCLYYLNSRYYMADWGRFISADSYVQTGQGMLDKNMFAYCGNNPVARADENGDLWHIVAGAVIGGIAGFVGNVVSSLITGKGVDLGAAAISAGFGAATGALIAACPAYAVVASATLSAAESVVQDVREGKATVGEMVVNATVSAGFGALTGSWGSSFANNNIIDDAVKALPKILKGNHPVVKNAAKKCIKSALKYISKNFVSEQIETIMYETLETGTQKASNLIINSYYEEAI